MSRPAPIPASTLPADAFRARQRIHFPSCDPAGIVYFAAWFSLAGVAIEDFLTDGLGVSFAELISHRRIGTGFAHASADYFAPGLLGDAIAIVPLVTRIGRASYELVVHIHRDEQELVRMRMVTATTDLNLHKPVPVPPDLRAALEDYRIRCGGAP
jgi:acyl-CoA thioesterase FadM